MPEYEQSGTVTAPPDQLFAYLADVHHLPEYFPHMTAAEPAGGEDVHVEAEVEGDHQEAVAWFHVDEEERRIEWGSKSGPYHGWMQVDGVDGGSLVTIHLHQEHETDSEADLAQAIETIQARAGAPG
ncbi:SRPBCC family protein [Luedemannella flava]|uniref:SRPBCC family protein n=1 Tax=Luedemannella flava TaxID=349316 RepID=A0ABP4YQT7_9ACTN